MEGCLYRKCDNRYYLINTIATYNYIAIEFDTFISCFIQNENFNVKYELIEFNSANVKMLLDNYDEFNGYIDYGNLDEFYHISYNDKIYIIKSWRDVFNFVAGRI
jgi:hypothetical protein